MITSVLGRDVLIGGVTPYVPPVYTAGLVLFSDGAGAPSVDSAFSWNNTSKTLKISTNGQALDGTGTDTPQIHIGGDFDGITGFANLMADTYGGASVFTFRNASGTQASKTATVGNAIILNFRAQGWNGSAYANGGFFRFLANGLWSGSNHGMDFVVMLTPNGATSAPAVKMRVIGTGEGGVGIGTEGLVSIDTALVVRRANPPDIGYVARFYSNLTAYVQIRSGSGANEQAGFALLQNTNSFEWRVAVIGNDGNALRFGGGSGGTDVKFYMTQNGNFCINNTNIDPTAGTKLLIFGEGTAPSGMDSNTAAIYADDVGGTVNIFAINEAGEITRLTFPAPQTYNVTNVTTDRAYDANSTTLDEIADVLGTLISDLRNRGIVA